MVGAAVQRNGPLSAPSGVEELLRRLAEPARGDVAGVDAGDLALLFLCCHPSLSPATRLTLTLRVSGGLTAAEIGQALRQPAAAVRQRIDRARRQIMEGRDAFGLPMELEWGERLGAVLRTLHHAFAEGAPDATASMPRRPGSPGPSTVAIRLARRLHRALPEEGEVAGLLALMLLTEARRPAAIGPDGALVPMSEQDRALWDEGMIAEGAVLITQALVMRPIGPYQLRAAIAAAHDEAPAAERTDWRQILTLYALLDVIAPGPEVGLDRVVAVAMVQGAGVARRELAEAEVREPELAEHPRLDAVKAWLLALSGEEDAARDHYRRAALRAPTLAERRYLESRANRPSPGPNR